MRLAGGGPSDSSDAPSLLRARPAPRAPPGGRCSRPVTASGPGSSPRRAGRGGVQAGLRLSVRRSCLSSCARKGEPVCIPRGEGDGDPGHGRGLNAWAGSPETRELSPLAGPDPISLKKQKKTPQPSRKIPTTKRILGGGMLRDCSQITSPEFFNIFFSLQYCRSDLQTALE